MAEEEVKRIWENIPDEAVEYIFRHLHLDDIRSCHSLFKSWHAYLGPTTHWLMHKQCEKPSYQLFHPLLSGLKQHDDVPDALRFDHHQNKDAVPRFSRDGWILMSSGDGYSVFFYNPVTESVIRLPDLTQNSFEFNGACFSDRVVFGILSIWDDFLNIATIRPGEKKWSFNYIENNLPFTSSFCNPVFHKGMVYCLGTKGNLGVYDLEKNKWTVLDKPQNPISRKTAFEHFLVDCGGDLISVFLGRLKSWISVYRLNDSKMVWEQVNDLGDYALFLSNPSSFSTNNVIPMLKNKIFLAAFHNNYVVFYSFDTRKFETFGSDLCEENLRMCEIANQLESCWIEWRKISGCDNHDKKLVDQWRRAAGISS